MMKAGRFIVRISRWMARSLHELAARIERWSGAASTPPPAAPPLPDPVLQALAERFPDAPEHWLRMVASRIGAGGMNGVGATRPAAQHRQQAQRPAPRFPESHPGRRRGPEDLLNKLAPVPMAPSKPVPAPWPDTVAPHSDTCSPRFIAGNPPQQSASIFASGRESVRAEPRFPQQLQASAAGLGAAGSIEASQDSHRVVRFPAFSANPKPVARFPGQPDPEAEPATRPRQQFAPLGGQWREGYEVRQPGELTNIWPELPPVEQGIPDAQPLLPDEDAIRLEQMVTRWSA